MRTDGIWNPRLIQIVAALGHTDTLVIADAGLPVPPGVECIDLVWTRGQPGLLPVLSTVLVDLGVEAATIADELDGADLLAGLRDTLGDIPIDRISHQALKRAVGSAKAVVRTGETTPFANVILRAGVVF